MVTPSDPFHFVALVGAYLDALRIRYVVGGSVASSFYGEPRTTLDLDVMIEAGEADVTALVDSMKHDFYVDAEDAVDAVRYGRSFNAIHFATTTKVDFFIAEDRDEVRAQLARRRAWETPSGTVWFYAPEDVIVRKLVWFRMGGEQSDRQWRDIAGLLRLPGTALDRSLLARAAADFAVGDLLERAQRDVDATS
jgi:hypothetical protein